jgi:hypothetical protein
MLMKDGLVSSLPIQEMRDTMLNPEYFTAFQRYLEQECKCTCIALDDTSILVRFPEGTMEEEYQGTSTTWRRETMICLPDGVKLIKRVHLPMKEGEKELIALVLPPHALTKKYRDERFS